jgi:hypothetical protein
MAENKTHEFKVMKSNDEKRQIFGWSCVSKDSVGEIMVDHSGDIVDIEEIEKAAYSFVKLYRDGSDNHERGGVATLIESIVFTKEKINALGIADGILPEGWFIGFEVHDDDVWEKVKDGTYSMLSIEGTAEKIPIS